MPTAVYALEVALALGLIIFVHELGHFLAAKVFGVRVRRFGFGLPFTRPLVKWTRGETEYGFYPVLIGGFVDLAGEHRQAEGADDPKALWRRPAWQRIVIFSAGVAMNTLLAFAFFSAAFLTGVKALSPVVGGTLPDSPAEKAGIRPGDRIVALGGRPVRSFDDLVYRVSLQDEGTEFRVSVERPAENGAAIKVPPITIKSYRPAGAPMPLLGLFSEREPVVAAIAVGSDAQQAGLRPGDRILEAAGKRPERWRDLRRLVEDPPPGPLALTVEREGERIVLDKWRPYGFDPPTAVRQVLKDAPAAAAGIEPGDRIMKIAEVAWPTIEEVRTAVQGAGVGGTVRLVLWRKGEAVEATCTTTMREENGKPRPVIGVAMAAAIKGPVQVGQVKAGGMADRAGFRAGDVLVGIGRRAREKSGLKGMVRRLWKRLTRQDADFDTPETIVEVLAQLYETPEKPLPVIYERGEALGRTTLALEGAPLERFSLDGCEGRPLYIELPRIYNPLQASAEGLKQTWMWLRRIYATIGQLARRQVSTETVGGPVLIVKASLDVAELGIGTFLYFWGTLAVCVTVLNFLPVPPFDGGHVLFVLIEKAKGSPVSLKVQGALWTAGWVLVGALMVLILIKDVSRLL